MTIQKGRKSSEKAACTVADPAARWEGGPRNMKSKGGHLFCDLLLQDRGVPTWGVLVLLKF